MTRVTKDLPGTVDDAVSRLRALLQDRGVTVFAVIDQAAAAREVGLELRPTVLVVFGNPAAGTPVMAAAPEAALDLPLKVLIWDDGGRTRLAYYDPVLLAESQGVPHEVAAPLAAIDRLTDALANDLRSRAADGTV
jgi:uncharacterized protein (DUF302 family)